MISPSSFRKRCSFLVLLFVLITHSSFAQLENTFFKINGTVIDALSQKVIPQTSIRIKNTNIGTISNSEGEFSLKIPHKYKSSTIQVTHLGYTTASIPITEVLKNNAQISLQPVIQNLNEIQLTYINAGDLVKKIFEKRSLNYSKERNLLTSFYRETIKKENEMFLYPKLW